MTKPPSKLLILFHFLQYLEVLTFIAVSYPTFAMVQEHRLVLIFFSMDISCYYFDCLVSEPPCGVSFSIVLTLTSSRICGLNRLHRKVLRAPITQKKSNSNSCTVTSFPRSKFSAILYLF